jgi:hypothetical protein
MSYDPRRRRARRTRRARPRRRRYDFDFDPARRFRLRRPSPAILKGWIKPIFAGLVAYAFGEKVYKYFDPTDQAIAKIVDASGNEYEIMKKSQLAGIVTAGVSGAVLGGRSKIIKNGGLGALGGAVLYIYDKFFHK